MKNLLGSNQYQTKRRGFQFKGYKEVFVICLILIPVMVFGHMAQQNQPGKFISPLPNNAYTQSIKTKLPELAPLSERKQNIDLIKRIWGQDSKIGLAIARAESGYRSHAVNYNTNNTVDQGVFQINSVHSIPEMFDATANVSYAYSIYLKQGTTPWNSSKHTWIKWL